MRLYNNRRLYVKKYNLSVQFLLTSAEGLGNEGVWATGIYVVGGGRWTTGDGATVGSRVADAIRLKGSGCVVGRDACDLRYFRHSFFVSEHSSLPMECHFLSIVHHAKSPSFPHRPAIVSPARGDITTKSGQRGRTSIHLLLTLYYIYP
jgi:hypothetical protein